MRGKNRLEDALFTFLDAGFWCRRREMLRPREIHEQIGCFVYLLITPLIVG